MPQLISRQSVKSGHQEIHVWRAHARFVARTRCRMCYGAQWRGDLRNGSQIIRQQPQRNRGIFTRWAQYPNDPSLKSLAAQTNHNINNGNHLNEIAEFTHGCPKVALHAPLSHTDNSLKHETNAKQTPQRNCRQTNSNGNPRKSPGNGRNKIANFRTGDSKIPARENGFNNSESELFISETEDRTFAPRHSVNIWNNRFMHALFNITLEHLGNIQR